MSDTILPLTEIQQIVSEAEAFNKDMEERGYHTGGPADIEGVYDSRVYLLTCAVHALLTERERACRCTVKHEGPCESARATQQPNSAPEWSCRTGRCGKCPDCKAAEREQATEQALHRPEITDDMIQAAKAAAYDYEASCEREERKYDHRDWYRAVLEGAFNA